MSQSDDKRGTRRGSPNYDPEFRQRLTLESCKPGVSVSKLAREHGINANMLFNWRRRYRERQKAAQATTATLIPVAVIETPCESVAMIAAPSAAEVVPSERQATPGTIEVRIGRAVIKVDGVVDGETLRTVLGSLRS